MVSPLPQMDRLSGAGLAALDRLSLAPSRDYAPQSSLDSTRTIRPGMTGPVSRDSMASGSGPRDFQSFAAMRAPSLGQSLGGNERTLGSMGMDKRSLTSQDTTYGRQIVDPTGGVNQPGLDALMGAQTGNTTGTGQGALGSPGGKWAGIDQWDGAVSAAASKYGVDPNRIKAHMMIESGGTGSMGSTQVNPTYGNTYGMMQINPAIWEGTLRAQGIDMYTPEGNIAGAAYILSSLYKQYGDWDKASSAYFLGNPNWQGGDTVNGTSGPQYQKALNGYITELSSYGGAMNPNQQLRTAYGGQTAQGVGTASAVLNAAKQYVGTPYVWGAIPGKGQTPTGWDCSGMTYWLDQNYGTGTLPAGSHYQYQWAQQTGALRAANQLQPGDLVFFDTGSRAGGGGNLNAASHVGIYLGGDQFIHAANPGVGTIYSSLSEYMGMYPFLGGAAMSWSGGGSASNPYGSGVSPQNQALRQAYSGYGAAYGSTLNHFRF